MIAISAGWITEPFGEDIAEDRGWMVGFSGPEYESVGAGQQSGEAEVIVCGRCYVFHSSAPGRGQRAEVFVVVEVE